MQNKDWQEIIRVTTQLAMLVSPTGVEQAAFVRIQSDMYFTHTSKEVVLQLVGCIHDGLKNENWPKGD